MKTSISLGILCVLILTDRSAAQTSFPMVTHVFPVAIQRGQTVEITVDGQMNFAGAYKALFEGVGVSAEVTSPPPMPGTVPKSVKMKITIAKDAPLGVR